MGAFSRHKAAAKITLMQPSPISYALAKRFVTYYGKLCGVLLRLHHRRQELSQPEAGLAILQRAVKHHGRRLRREPKHARAMLARDQSEPRRTI